MLGKTAAVTTIALMAAGTTAGAAAAQSPENELRATLAAQMAAGPEAAGAYVIDLDDGRVLFDDRSRERLLSASVTKLYTTATALLELGAEPRLRTRVLGTGRRNGATWRGNLYLRGVGDFTFGTAAFGRSAYGGGGTVEELAGDLRRAGIRRVRGSVFADTSLFTDGEGSSFDLVLCPDPLFGRGCPYGPNGRLERPIPNGPRTAIAFNRGLKNATSADGQEEPARFAARRLIRELEARGIRVSGRAREGATPGGADPLAATESPTMATLTKLVNRPSDNYAAETLFRVLGAREARDGSGAGGARVVSRTIRQRFGIEPEIESGSGETIRDRTSPRELVRLLSGMRGVPQARAFERSLSVAGRSGTLLRFEGTPVESRCLLKDGTRVDEPPRTTLNMTGYCETASGRTLAFAVMMNGMPLEFVPPDRIESPAYALQDRFVRALAEYRGR
jgi:serine-type D-Ala-D-Ala carboxypeptidase/endopeptidase (penicillin-binding protein 4)